jgi:hypothetical protein
VASAIGVRSHAQISMLLGRLARDGLLIKRQGAPGHPNAWLLSLAGHRLARMLERQPQHMCESQFGDTVRMPV